MTEDLKIYKVNYADVIKEYPGLYEEIFDDVGVGNLPTYVYIGFVGREYIGFMAGYLHKVGCIYMQNGGFVDKYKGYNVPKLFREIIDFVQKEYEYIIFRTENTNISMIKVALNAGFLIVGTRLDGVLFVELMKERTNAN